MKQRPVASRGFTVAELLAVLGTVTILLVIAVPAIEKSRADAKSVTCRNRLKTLGLALHNYHDTFLTFPPGWILKSDAADAGPAMNWQVSLLPYLDQQKLFKVYNAINFHNPPSVVANPEFAKSLTEYRCPADPTDPSDQERGGFGVSNYAGNYGIEKLPGKAKAARNGARGIFHWNSCIRIALIVDGTSNTLMIGERCGATGAGLWPAARTNEFADDVVGSLNDALRLNTAKRAFSSKHAGGVNFLFCDGSVKYVSDKIESLREIDPPKGLLQKLACRDDRVPIDIDAAAEFFLPPAEKAEDKTPAKTKSKKSSKPKAEPDGEGELAEWKESQLSLLQGQWISQFQDTPDGEVRRRCIRLEFSADRLEISLFDEKKKAQPYWTGSTEFNGLDRVDSVGRIKLDRAELHYDFVDEKLIVVGSIGPRPFEGLQLSGEYTREKESK